MKILGFQGTNGYGDVLVSISREAIEDLACLQRGERMPELKIGMTINLGPARKAGRAMAWNLAESTRVAERFEQLAREIRAFDPRETFLDPELRPEGPADGSGR